MTTIITRVFPDKDSAVKAVSRLIFLGLPRRDCFLLQAGDQEQAKMERYDVHPSAIPAYLECLAAGNTLVIVHATYKPLAAARIVRESLATRQTVPVADVIADHFVKTKPQKRLSILRDHPLILTIPGMPSPGLMTPGFGLPMLTPRITKRSVISPSRHVSGAFWPMRRISRKRDRSPSVFSGKRFMSRLFWPMPLLSRKERTKSVIPGGALPFSRAFGMRTISR